MNDVVIIQHRTMKGKKHDQRDLYTIHWHALHEIMEEIHVQDASSPKQLEGSKEFT